VKLSTDRFRFDRSPYERPSRKWRCGRAAIWGRPCPMGPNGDGSCGGVTACRPFHDASKDRWECRRSLSAGGPCAEGPDPEGRCARRRPPCVPRRSLQHQRSRISFLAVIVVIAVLGSIIETGKDAHLATNSLSPGVLSGSHLSFLGDDCGACHVAHDGDLEVWLGSIFAGQDMTSACLDCHVFEGDARNPHNVDSVAMASLRNPDFAQMECISCHTEHDGLNASLVEMTDAQCRTCHLVAMKSFTDHVPFGEFFPSLQRTALWFDHVSHLGKHFAQAAADDPTGCVDCHVVDRATDSVPVRGFAESCASCHTGDLDDRPLPILALPEFSAEQFAALDHEYLSELCPDRGSPEFYQSLVAARAAVAEGDPFGEFESVAFGESMTPLMQWVLDAETSDIYDLPADEGMVDDLLWLYLDLADSGGEPLAGMLENRADGTVKGVALLAGLNDDTVRGAVCAWMANGELRQDPPPGGGWYVDGLTLNYVASGHADPVLTAWLDLAVAAPMLAAESGGDMDQALFVRDTLMHPAQGPGSCAKCHSMSASEGDPSDPAAPVEVGWESENAPWSPYVRYSHGPHLNILGDEDPCAFCHSLKDQSGIADAYETLDANHPVSSFQSIGNAQCLSCHGEGDDGFQAVAAEEGCLLCHNYHLEPGFRRRMVDAEVTRQ